MSTVVFFHAHPDDETLLTGGTMALLADQGHRVVLVTATNGEAGLSAVNASLGARRVGELTRAAQLLGCAAVEPLGFPDSGSGSVPIPGSFATLPVAEPAQRLAEILDREHAEVLTGYDPAGGYGHRDHVQAHRVARAAALIARPHALMEATVDRRALQRALRITQLQRWYGPDFSAHRFDRRYTAHELITHRIDVSDFAARKQAAMRAHHSQATAPQETRTLEILGRLPAPLFRAVFRREWYVQAHATAGRRPVPNFLADLRR